MTPDDPLGGFLGSYLEQQTEVASAAPGEENRPGEWRSLWTWIQLVDGEVLPACLEILGRARELADELGTRSCAVVFGHGIKDAARLGEHGADRVYVLDDAAFASFDLEAGRRALASLVRDRRPEALFFPATIQGRNLGAQVAAELGTGIVPNCRALSLDATERLLIGHQTSFEERLLSDVVVPMERPQIFTVTPGSFRRPAAERGRQATLVKIDAPPATRPRVAVLGLEPDRPKTLAQYDAVVAAGLGLGSQESVHLSQQLADELSAYAGATRGAVTCGWTKPGRLITVTHQPVRPRLYIGCGVVGEYDHLKAVEDAEFVVALTDDAGAPIAENADLVGLGDPSALLKRILEHIRTAKRDQVRLG